MRDVTIGEAVSSAPGAVTGQGSSRGPPQLVACSGQGKQGALAILRRNLVPELILKTSTPGQLTHQTFVWLLCVGELWQSVSKASYTLDLGSLSTQAEAFQLSVML